MALSCTEVAKQYLATLSSRFSCEALNGTLRVITPYLYPNNDLIEVFIQEPAPDIVRVSDLGETLRHLHSQGFDLAARPERRAVVETIASRTNVELSLGRLTKEGPLREFGDILFDVIVAARGVSDLIYTSRAYEPGTFLEEVGQFLMDSGLEHEPAKLTGQTGHVYTIQFRLHRGPTYLQTLSPKQPSGMRGQVNAVFRMWSDCNGNLKPDHKISLLNDIGIRWRSDDVALLDRVSTVANWSQRQDWVAKLRV